MQRCYRVALTTLSAAFAVSWSSVVVMAASDAASCASKPSDRERLECYDLAFRKVVKTATESKWTVQEEKSKIDDSKTVVLYLESSEPITNQYRQRVKASLTVACREGKTDLWIQMGGHFLSSYGGFGDVIYRVDERPAKKLRFQESTDHQALGLWRGPLSIPFIREIMDGSSMYIRITPYSESAVSAEFPISGMVKALEPLMAACNWTSSKPKGKLPASLSNTKSSR